MGRLIFVPQYPAPMRYASWNFIEFPKQFKKYFDEVIVLGKKYITQQKKIQAKGALFASVYHSIVFEQEQIKEYLGEVNLRKDDILFLADLSFPGFFANALYHKRPEKCFAYYHAGAKNAYDYFAHVRKSKWGVETGQSKIFDVIFVGSEYHKNKLIGWNNIITVGLPNPPLRSYPNTEKTKDIISVVRPCIQKVNKELEGEVEKKFGKITRTHKHKITSWKDYYRLISEHKILIISTKADTYGYGVVDAILNGTIPLAPNDFSYPELLPPFYLYNNIVDLEEKIKLILTTNNVQVPELLCDNLASTFYEDISSIMKE